MDSKSTPLRLRPNPRQGFEPFYFAVGNADTTPDAGAAQTLALKQHANQFLHGQHPQSGPPGRQLLDDALFVLGLQVDKNRLWCNTSRIFILTARLDQAVMAVFAAVKTLIWSVRALVKTRKLSLPDPSA